MVETGNGGKSKNKVFRIDDTESYFIILLIMN